MPSLPAFVWITFDHPDACLGYRAEQALGLAVSVDPLTASVLAPSPDGPVRYSLPAAGRKLYIDRLCGIHISFSTKLSITRIEGAIERQEEPLVCSSSIMFSSSATLEPSRK